MLNIFDNPFPVTDRDRYDLWQMLVERDINGFLQQDWNVVADDFIEPGFIGIDAGFSDIPDSWRLSFPNLKAYRDNWLRHCAEFANLDLDADPRQALFSATTMRDVEITCETALAHKKFDGQIKRVRGDTILLNWQTLYYCRKLNSKWKIAGFVGFMPNPMGQMRHTSSPVKFVPPSASQHSTAGPYSPVLIVEPGKIVVISGQAAIDQSGEVCGSSIEEQTEITLENCRRQLATAGCSLADVFKVNVYLKDLAEWSRFNSIYVKFIPEPRPVRTVVQAGLLTTFRVEIEMWGIKGR